MRLLKSIAFSVITLITASIVRAAPLTVTDDAGRKVTLPHVPQKIVSIAPGATEMLFAAGAGSRVIATVEFSDEPPAARDVPRIGDSAAIDVERVVALKPDVIVIWEGGSNIGQVAQLERLGLPLYRERVGRLAEIAPSLRRLGALTDTREAAEKSARDVDARLAALAQRFGGRAPVTVLLQVWNRPSYTVGGGQMMTDSVRVCGGRNIFADLKTQGPAVDVEAVIARDPQVIVAVAPPGTANDWLN